MISNQDIIESDEYKNLSPILENLINEANETIEKSETTIKEKLLAVYNQAIKENFSSIEARKLLKEKITNVSDRYIRKVLPDEAKRDYNPSAKLNHSAQFGTVPILKIAEKDKKVVNITTHQPIIKEADEYKPSKQLEEFREQKGIIEPKNYRLTLYFAGKDVSVIVAIVDDKLKIIPENKYVKYDLLAL